jgi:hypothetical protein
MSRALGHVFRFAQGVAFPQQWERGLEDDDILLATLIADTDLDQRTTRRGDPDLRRVDDAIDFAIAGAYGRAEIDEAPVNERAHRFLQRALYRINRLTLFWYDDLARYRNERSAYLHGVRARIEDAWQIHEVAAHAIGDLRTADVAATLRAWAERDVDPPPSPAGQFFRDRASEAAYRRLLAIASLDGLVEASQLSRTLGGVSNPIHATMTKLLVEEYGGGRLAKKHSSYFRIMLETLGMDVRPEAYFDLVPWEVLSCINQSFLWSDRKRLFLRYVGGLLYTEISVPAAFRCYRAAAMRLGLPEEASRYWDLHVKEDARHGPWMLHEVALPLAERYPNDAWELLLGYDQQRRMSGRAAAATAQSAEAAEEAADAA